MVSKGRIINIICTFQKPELLERILDRWSLYLIYAFFLSITATNFIAVLTASGVTSVDPTTSAHLTQEQLAALSHTKTVSWEELQLKQDWSNQVNYTGLTAILGWLGTSPSCQRGIARIVSKITKK